jgi:hypothetical protein
MLAAEGTGTTGTGTVDVAAREVKVVVEVAVRITHTSRLDTPTQMFFFVFNRMHAKAALII